VVMESSVTKIGTHTRPAMSQAVSVQRALDRVNELRINCRVPLFQW
jgi:hypothetical protein